MKNAAAWVEKVFIPTYEIGESVSESDEEKWLKTYRR